MAQYNEVDASPLITESAKLKFTKVFVNGFQIRTQDMLDLQITFGAYKRGIISFVDSMNITETTPFTLAYIDISYQDALNGKYTDSFVATKIRSDRNKDATITNMIHFEDLATNTLRLSHISKGYKNVTMLEVIEDLFDILGLAATFVANGDERIYESFVVPTNISTLEFITNQCDNSNILMFSDRNGYRFVTRDIMDFNSLALPVEPNFTLDNTASLPYWNILEYNGDISGIAKLQSIAPLKSYRIDDGDLKISPSYSDISTVYEKQNLNNGFGFNTSVISDLLYNVGVKNVSTISVNDRLGISSDYRQLMNESQTIDIVVQGLIGQRMFTQIKIDLPRPRGIAGGSDTVHGGFFVITEVTDKIMAGNFLQYLTIQRCDYGKGVEYGK